MTDNPDISEVPANQKEDYSSGYKPGMLSSTAFAITAGVSMAAGMLGCSDYRSSPQEALKLANYQSEAVVSEDTDPENNDGDELVIARGRNYSLANKEGLLYAFNEDGEGAFKVRSLAMKDDPSIEGRETQEDFKGFGNIYKRQNNGGTEYLLETIYETKVAPSKGSDSDNSPRDPNLNRVVLTPNEEGNYSSRRLENGDENPSGPEWEHVKSFLKE